jgi:aminobenzoyl-glutamate transport protein
MELEEEQMHKGTGARILDWVERTGNRLPDPAIHFLIALTLVWVCSALLAGGDFGVTDPRSGKPLQIINQLDPKAFAKTLEGVVSAYVGFPPLGVVLVLALGVGIAEHSGLVAAGLQKALAVAPVRFLTPMLVAATVASSIAGDAALLIMAPLGGAVFFAAGRHPLAGVMAAATANHLIVAGFLPTGIDTVLQGLSQKAAQMLDAGREVNVLCNWLYSAAAGAGTILALWWVVDRVLEPRLAATPVDGDPAELPKFSAPTARENRALVWAAASLVALIGLAAAFALPASSPLRSPEGTLTGTGSPLMRSIVPLMLLLTGVPGLVYGYAAGVFTHHKQVVKAMSRTLSSMGYYMVMVFFASQFIRAFSESNLGALLALKGGIALKALALPPLVTLIGLILLSATINLMIASASAKWAMIFVPMLMTAGIAPEATQIAYRIGDSSTNMLTPLNPYFPLIVAFCARYVKGAGIGTIISLSLPMCAACLTVYLVLLAAFWGFGVPLGIGSHFIYP